MKKKDDKQIFVDRAVKQIIVMRKDLKMRRGKEIAQGSHASLAVVLNAMKKNDDTFKFNVEKNSPWDKWLNGGFTKICVSCNSEKNFRK